MTTASATSPRTSPALLHGPLRWLVRGLALVAVCAAFSVIPINTVRGSPQGYWPLLVMFVNAIVATAYIGVGWLLTERRPTNLVGPLLLAVGVLWAAASPMDLYLSQVFDGVDQADLPLARHAALYMMAIGYPMSVLGAIALVLFPDGRPMSRWFLLFVLAVCALAMLGAAAYAFGSGTFGPLYRSIESPFRIPGFPKRTLLSISDVAGQALSLLTVVAVAARWYRGSPVVRAQVKWVVLAGLVTFITGFVAEQLDDGRRDWPMVIAATVSSASGLLLPLAIGVAIMRHRLYDIDRIVSRTVAYGAITAILLFVFVAVNLVALAVVSAFVSEAGGTLSTAFATLAAAALFTPLRSRAQRIVDRRFHRSHYDAQRVVDAFGGRLRGQVDLAFVERELRLAVATAVEPTTTSIWLRAERTRGRRPEAAPR